MYDDVFLNFQSFFGSGMYDDSRLLQDLAKGLKPRRFSKNDDSRFILEEGSEVQEIYLLMNGLVSVGFTTYETTRAKPGYMQTYLINKQEAFGDYYVFFNTKSEFVYKAESPEVTCFALEKRFLIQRVFPKYPHKFLKDFQDRARKNYNQMKESVVKHRRAHIEEVNTAHQFIGLNLFQKKFQVTDSAELLLQQNNPDSHIKMKTRIDSLHRDFMNCANSLDTELEEISNVYDQFVNKINLAQSTKEWVVARKQLHAVLNQD